MYLSCRDERHSRRRKGSWLRIGRSSSVYANAAFLVFTVSLPLKATCSHVHTATSARPGPPKRLQLPSGTAWHNGSCGGSFMMCPPLHPTPTLLFPVGHTLTPFVGFQLGRTCTSNGPRQTLYGECCSQILHSANNLSSPPVCARHSLPVRHILAAPQHALAPPAGKKRQPEGLHWPTTSSLALV